MGIATQPDEQGSRLWAPLAVVAAAVLPYLPGVTAPFTEWDDPYYVLRNKRLLVAGWKGISELWVFENSLRYEQVEFFPLRDTAYWLIHQLFGLNPVPYHAVNIAFHALASALVWVFAQELGFSRRVGFVAALLFALHPVHTESVVWVSGLKDPMFLSAMLGSLICYLRYRKTLRPGLYAAALVLLAAALACKSLALPTVLLMVAAERLVGTPTRWRLVAARAAGPMALTVLSFAHIVAIGRATAIIVGPHGGNWTSHWVLMSWALVRYVQQAIAPANFRLYYCFAPAEGLSDLRLLGACVAVLALAAVGVVLFRRDRRLAFLWLWFFLCLGPVANLIPFPALMADRYLYSPTVAVALLFAVVLSKAKGARVLTGALVLTLAVVTALRSEAWQRPEELWDEVSEDRVCWEDNSILALNVLMQGALTQTDPARAYDAFVAATRHPAFKSYDPEMRCDRFRKSALDEPLDDATLELKAAELMAFYCSNSVRAWERLALSTWRDRPDVAARASEKAYALAPMSYRRWRLGLARFNAKDPRARVDIEAALRWEPGFVCPSFRQVLPTLSAARQAELEGLDSLCPAN